MVYEGSQARFSKIRFDLTTFPNGMLKSRFHIMLCCISSSSVQEHKQLSCRQVDYAWIREHNNVFLEMLCGCTGPGLVWDDLSLGSNFTKLGWRKDDCNLLSVLLSKSSWNEESFEEIDVIAQMRLS